MACHSLPLRPVHALCTAPPACISAMSPHTALLTTPYRVSSCWTATTPQGTCAKQYVRHCARHTLGRHTCLLLDGSAAQCGSCSRTLLAGRAGAWRTQPRGPYPLPPLPVHSRDFVEASSAFCNTLAFRRTNSSEFASKGLIVQQKQLSSSGAGSCRRAGQLAGGWTRQLTDTDTGCTRMEGRGGCAHKATGISTHFNNGFSVPTPPLQLLVLLS